MGLDGLDGLDGDGFRSPVGIGSIMAVSVELSGIAAFFSFLNGWTFRTVPQVKI